jgi:hypothetical protein
MSTSCTSSAPTLFDAGRYDTLDPMAQWAAASHSLPKERFEVLDTRRVSVVDAPDVSISGIDGFLLPLA